VTPSSQGQHTEACVTHRHR